MRRKTTMRRTIVDWFFGMEDALILNGTTRTGLAFGFAGDVLAGQKPLVLQAWSARRRKERAHGIRNVAPHARKDATPGGLARSRGRTLNQARPPRGSRPPLTTLVEHRHVSKSG